MKNNYRHPLGIKNGHLQTIVPSLFRRVHLNYRRERITTFDDDFIDIDWSGGFSDYLAILSHGLEGSTDRAYIKGMVNALNLYGWDALAWNYRSCSGESNRKLRSYHNGVTDDLAWIIDHAKKTHPYKKIALIGFSLGGNLTLLYLGRDKPDALVQKAVVFSVPCDLAESAKTLAKPSNSLYMKRFLMLLHKKIKQKQKIMPDLIDDRGYHQIKDFKGFDDRYTAPIHGFKNAEDYWKKCSSKPHISSIPVPTLIINAQNDPFLPLACYPIKEARLNKNISLQMPLYGGHVGFMQLNRDGLYWSEKQAVSFLNQDI